MAQVAVFENGPGLLRILGTAPGGDAMEEAIRFLPTGQPFLIMDRADLPPRELREAWTIDPVDLTSGVGG